MKRTVILVYLAAALHVVLLMTVGEAFPCLQGPNFGGHAQRGDLIHLPVPEITTSQRGPAFDKLYRHETLAMACQRDQAKLCPLLDTHAHRQFLIGHSLRTPFPREVREPFDGIRWTTRTYRITPTTPVEFVEEHDHIHD